MPLKRTSHAEQRISQGRLGELAEPDAKKANRNQVFKDTETGYYVVKGPHKRIHLFEASSGELWHHTTFENRINNTRARLLIGRWRYLSEVEYREWLDVLNRSIQGE